MHDDPGHRHAAQAPPQSAAADISASLDTTAFWRSHTIAELQEEQGTTGQVDPADMALTDLSDSEREAFIAELDQ